MLTYNFRLTNQVSLSRLEELYNVRPGFKPLKTFQKGCRILIILIKGKITRRNSLLTEI